jgi:hypothetical protein
LQKNEKFLNNHRINEAVFLHFFPEIKRKKAGRENGNCLFGWCGVFLAFAGFIGKFLLIVFPHLPNKISFFSTLF